MDILLEDCKMLEPEGVNSSEEAVELEAADAIETVPFAEMETGKPAALVNAMPFEDETDTATEEAVGSEIITLWACN